MSRLGPGRKRGWGTGSLRGEGRGASRAAPRAQAGSARTEQLRPSPGLGRESEAGGPARERRERPRRRNQTRGLGAEVAAGPQGSGACGTAAPRQVHDPGHGRGGERAQVSTEEGAGERACWGDTARRQRESGEPPHPVCWPSSFPGGGVPSVQTGPLHPGCSVGSRACGWARPRAHRLHPSCAAAGWPPRGPAPAMEGCPAGRAPPRPHVPDEAAAKVSDPGGEGPGRALQLHATLRVRVCPVLTNTPRAHLGLSLTEPNVQQSLHYQPQG